MYFGVDYYPEHWVYPYGGTPEEPEARWEEDAKLMVKAGFNVVRMGEFAWGIYEPENGRFDFDWMRRVMDIMGRYGLKVVLGTPTAAPPIWLAREHPEILPVDEHGLRRHEGTRRAYCLNSDVFWMHCERIIRGLAGALGDHPQLVAWQIDNGLGGHQTESSFNEEARRDWQAWLQAKYETIESLNQRMGTRFWGQMVTDWAQVPMPMAAPTVHNPALVLDWRRFSSDTIVWFERKQAEILHELTPHCPVTSNLRALSRKFDHFDAAQALDFVSLDSNATLKSRAAELACELDMMRSLKKEDVRTPDREEGFWVIEQKAGNVNWQEVNSLVRPGVVRLFTYQQISRGASGVLYFHWRQSRIGSEQFYGGVLSHDGRTDRRVFKEISQIGDEIRLLAPVLQGTKVVAEVCLLHSHDNEWALDHGAQPNRYFHLGEHRQLFYNALHAFNVAIDFARPVEDLSRYKVVFAPSLHLLAGGEADLLKLYVQNGGTLVTTFNTGLVDEYHIAPDSGFPHDLIDLLGLEIEEFDPLPPSDENLLMFKGGFSTSQPHPARLWCDIINLRGAQTLATFAKDFYAGRPAVTMHHFGNGRAIYIGTMSHQPFYSDLIAWVAQLCDLTPLLKVPEAVEVSVRQKDGAKIYFLLNHHHSPVRIQFPKPMHDFLTGSSFSGSYDLPPHGVLVLDERFAPA